MPTEPTPLDEVFRNDFIRVQVRERGGLGRREKLLLALSLSAGFGTPAAMAADVRRSLESGALSVAELREVALHVAAYLGYPRALELDESIGREWAKLAPEDEVAAETTGWRQAELTGGEAFAEVTGNVPGTPDTPFRSAVLEYVFGKIWTRPGLSRRDRRVISLACASLSGHEIPIRSHVKAALATEDLSPAELDEVVLQLSTYAGMPIASYLAQIVAEEAADFAKRPRDPLQAGVM